VHTDAGGSGAGGVGVGTLPRLSQRAGKLGSTAAISGWIAANWSIAMNHLLLGSLVLAITPLNAQRLWSFAGQQTLDEAFQIAPSEFTEPRVLELCKAFLAGSSLARDFNTLLRKKTGLTNVEVTIEDGWWFAGEPRYPIYNRFLPYMEPPTFEEFKRHTRFYCGDGDCIQMGPARQ
jgi:hypothetical protein